MFDYTVPVPLSYVEQTPEIECEVELTSLEWPLVRLNASVRVGRCPVGYGAAPSTAASAAGLCQKCGVSEYSLGDTTESCHSCGDLSQALCQDSALPRPARGWWLHYDFENRIAQQYPCPPGLDLRSDSGDHRSAHSHLCGS